MSELKINIIKILSICFIALFFMNNKAYANEQIGHSPEFYGTTNITILVGDELDLKKSFYRIFAKDYEDGNITQKIKIKSNNVETNKIGEYSIEYEVEDSDGNIASKTVPVQVVELGENRKIQRTLYTLPSVAEMEKAGFYRGNKQDKQDLGIYLPKGVSVTARQVVNNDSNLTVEFYNDDELKESVYCANGSIASKGDEEDKNFISEYDIEVKNTNKKIPSDTTTSVKLENVVSVKYKEQGSANTEANWNSWEKYDNKSFDSVPFIKTLYGEENNPVIEIILNDAVKPLDYYTYGDSQEEFKDEWENSGNGFSVIEGSRVTFLVPRKDLEELGVSKKGTENKYRNDNFNSIDEILSYYDNIIEEFDEYIGLSYTTENNINKNVKTKYFIKPNIHGKGYAAYAYWKYTYMSTDTLSAFIHNEDDGWAPLHEIGHGYQGFFKDHEGLDLGEVSNNFLAYYYQKEKLGEDWLSGYVDFDKRIIAGIREKDESYLITNGNNNQGIDEIDVYKIRLFAYVNLLDKIGSKESLSYLYSSYRDLIDKKEIKVNDSVYDGSNLMAKAFSESSEYNVIPYLEEWKLSIEEDIKNEIYNKDYQMLYFLRDLVGSDEKAEEIKEDLGLQWNYSLVSNEDVSKYNLKGNVIISMDESQFEELKGHDIILKSGKNIVKQIEVDSDNILLENLPIGIYEIETSNPEKFITNPRYVVVTQGETKEFEITTIEDKKLTGITILQEPSKTEYIEGETFDKRGMAVIATYNDGTTKEISDSEYTIENGDELSLGQSKVLINYTENGQTSIAFQIITVIQKLEMSVENYIQLEEDGEKYIEKIAPGTKLQEFKENIKTNGNITVYKGSSEIADTDSIMTTGMVIKVTLGSQEINSTLVVTGDLDGDGQIGNIDLLRLARYRAKLYTDLSGASLRATDVNQDGVYADSKDLLRMARVLAGLANL